MTSVNTLLQSFFYKQNPVDPIAAWKMYIDATPPVADQANIKWAEYMAIANRLHAAGVADWLLGIGVTPSAPVVLDRYDRSFDPEGRNCVFGTYQNARI